MSQTIIKNKEKKNSVTISFSLKFKKSVSKTVMANLADNSSPLDLPLIRQMDKEKFHNYSML